MMVTGSIIAASLPLHDIAYPRGSVKHMGLATDRAGPGLEEGVLALSAPRNQARSG